MKKFSKTSDNDFKIYEFKYSFYLKKNKLFQWYKKYCYNPKGWLIFSMVAIFAPLLLFVILSINQSYLLPNDNSVVFNGLNKQIQQLIDYGYEQQAKEWPTFVILSIYNILFLSILIILYTLPRVINFTIKSWIYHEEDRGFFLTKKGIKYFFNNISIVFIGVILFGGGLIAFTFFSVDDPALPATTIYMFYPGISLLPYFIIGISSIAMAFSVYILFSIIFIEFPCLIIGHFRYKDYEKKMQEGKVKYTMQTFYKEEMQENITPPLRPKDKWDKYDDLWDD